MQFDAIIIGAGQAGVPLAGALTKKGWRVALAEGNLFGGTCVNVGCTPTKTIIASAHAAHIARRGADFGVHTGEIRIDFGKVMERAHTIAGTSRGNIEKRFNENPKLTVFREYAQFESAHRVRVGDTVIEADKIYINTGARASAPPIPGLDSVPHLDNVSILELKAVPEHLVVIGGGYIGLEYAQAFRRFGSRVTIIQSGAQLLDHEDADLAAAAVEILRGENIDVRLNARAKQVEAKNGGVAVTVGQEVISGSHLLVAAGRKPNSDQLALDKAGIATDKRGFIVVDDHLQTSVPGVWALGDVNGRGAFTHTSWNDYEIVLDNLDGGTRKVSDRIPTYAVYLDPPLARVGMSEQDVRADGRKALIGVMQMKDISRAKERAETLGFMKVLVDATTERILGAAVFGIGGDELIHSLTALMYADAPYTVMKNAVHIHPTVSELLPTLLQDLQVLA